MNREIKFRVWNKSDKRMITAKNCQIDFHGCLTSNAGYDVSDNYELMQYTGLKDNKRTKEFPEGQEIYEGDIRVAPGQSNSYLQVIEFHNTEQTCGRGWIGRNIGIIDKVKWHTDKTIDIIEPIEGFSYHGLLNIGEVVGNIHENPELTPNQTKHK